MESLSDLNTERRVRRFGLPALSHVLVGLFVALVVVSAPLAVPATALADTSVATSTVATASRPYSSNPFISSPARKTWYRIPAIITNARGDLLAFAERRNNSNKTDLGNFDIVMRKSTNGGHTWGPLKVVANDGANTVMSPVPVLDRATGDILLITCIHTTSGGSKGAFMQRSTDGGDTFTPLLQGSFRPRGSWKGGVPGPGSGIVLANGPHAGRILVAFGYKSANRYGGYGMYSDDGGRSWVTGYDQAGTAGKVGYIEGTLAELSDGTVVISYRDRFASDPAKTRYTAYSTDGGQSLSSGFTRQSNLRINPVEASLLNPTGTFSGLLLFSAPSATARGNPKLRRDMAIFTSSDHGLTWSKPYHLDLEPRQAAYSDQVQVGDGGVGVLYETGKTSWGERITFRYIPLAELTNPTLAASSVKASLSARSVSTTRRVTVKTTVAVKGIGSPSGNVHVKYTRTTGASGQVSAGLSFANRGLRYVTLPKLKRGSYRISVTYSGTSRISAKTVSVGTLTVR
jgi:sialidase-1